jgi:Mg-chelatase subunit ChlD
MVGRAIRVEPTAAEEPPYTDGQVIYLAAGPDGASKHIDTLVSQAALLAAGSLDLGVMRKLLGRPGAARRYLAVEGWRALAVTAGSLPRVPLVRAATRTELLSSSPEESLALAVGRRPLPEPPPAFGVLRPRRVLAVGPVEDAAALTARELEKQQEREDELPEFDENEETESIGILLKLFSSSLRNPAAQWLQKLLGAGRQLGSGSAGAELPIGGARLTNRGGAEGVVTTLPARLAPILVTSERGWGWKYPEWDADQSRYREQWCTVTEVDPGPSDLRPFNPPLVDLRRRLARLGVGLERRRRQPQGDDIDLDAAVESRVEALAGSTPDEGLYVESQRHRRSLAVLVLLDISGSVVDRGGVHGNAHEQQRRAAALLVDTLHGLGDRVALYAFRSEGRSSVYLVRVKRFDEVLDGMTYERLGGLNPGGYTRLGAAIRHSTHVLVHQAGTEQRLLVVLSDGVPYDHGYEGACGEADASHALAEARREGIGCLCLTLGATTEPRALRRVFGTAAHARAPRIEDLTARLAPLFRQALASADLQRRLAQRGVA